MLRLNCQFKIYVKQISGKAAHLFSMTSLGKQSLKNVLKLEKCKIKKDYCQIIGSWKTSVVSEMICNELCTD